MKDVQSTHVIEIAISGEAGKERANNNASGAHVLKDANYKLLVVNGSPWFCSSIRRVVYRELPAG